MNTRSNETSNSFCYSVPKKTAIGTVEVTTPSGPRTVLIGRSDFEGFCAATVINGSIWFETAWTGLDALLLLVERLNSKNGER
ncbi:MAG TPA: hypothetical protein PKD24_05650 [Pyrinomonadaceae bacterium]|nr:hypothetical protein [Pyrinomonadaceae bacterium]HMP65035.1 hypothetical protein [Pyrinomonadaceae bacterium]